MIATCRPTAKPLAKSLHGATASWKAIGDSPKLPPMSLRGGWFHTADMATIDQDGYFLIVDRKKDIIVSGGENISSLELEKHSAGASRGARSLP